METPETTATVPAETAAAPVAQPPTEIVTTVDKPELNPEAVAAQAVADHPGDLPAQVHAVNEAVDAHYPETVVVEEPAEVDNEPEPEKWEHEPDWPHDELEFHGDTLAVKIPSKGMINALFHAGTTSPEFQYKLVSKFESTHISDASRERVLSRMADEDDPEYTSGEEWDELTSKLNEIGAERVRKDTEALAAVKG